jgi:mannose-6-phosphate isomerase
VRLAGASEEFSAEARTVLELSERYPGDAGVLAALLLQRVTLAPGEALYLPAGNLHAYLSGAAVELMANSDNVLRGGLTPKHVDVPELLKVLDFTAPTSAVLTGTPDSGWLRYDTPVEEFRLRRWEGGTDAGDVAVPGCGPRILVCTDGAVRVRSTGGELEIKRGSSVWLGAGERDVTVAARADGTRLFLASDGL